MNFHAPDEICGPSTNQSFFVFLFFKWCAYQNPVSSIWRPSVCLSRTDKNTLPACRTTRYGEVKGILSPFSSCRSLVFFIFYRSVVGPPPLTLSCQAQIRGTDEKQMGFVWHTWGREIRLSALQWWALPEAPPQLRAAAAPSTLSFTPRPLYLPFYLRNVGMLQGWARRERELKGGKG